MWFAVAVDSVKQNLRQNYYFPLKMPKMGL